MNRYVATLGPGTNEGSLLNPAGIEEAIALQHAIRDRVIMNRTISTDTINSIAGADAAYTSRMAFGAVVATGYPGGEPLCSSRASGQPTFPYIPGLFAFREGGVILSAVRALPCDFQVIMFHGQGIAHPRRAGLASHLGVLLDKPSIGIAEHLLYGRSDEPGIERGSLSPIVDGNERIGMAIRTRSHSRPVYVSIGHRVDLDQAVELVLGMTRKYRLPEPIRLAHHLAREQRTEWEKKREPAH